MTNYNERLEEILADIKAHSLLVKAENSVTGYDVYANPESGLVRAKQALTSLIKELVAEAKPGTWVDPEDTDDLEWQGYVSGVDDFEQNLLKALEEV